MLIKNKVKVLVPAYQFMWGGGSELIRLIITALKNSKKYEIFVLYEGKGEIGILKKYLNAIYSYLFEISFYLKIVLYKIKGVNVSLNIRNIIGSTLSVFEQQDFINHQGINKIYFEDSISLESVCNKYGIKYIIPNGITKKISGVKSIGYIFDFQHKYFPNLFSINERNKRNNSFLYILKNSYKVIVNSRAVLNDIEKYYPKYLSKAVSLPFSPISIESNEKISPFLYSLITNKYGINKKYIMISNQFWKHKSYETAFMAIKLLKEKHMFHDLCLVCTGKISDSRDKEYIFKLFEYILHNNISREIHILGHIPKNDQLVLMKKSICIIQPTKFEGGPGGGSVYDAICLGKQVIASDITINKEVEVSNIKFFKAGCAKSLSNVIYGVITKKIKSFPYNREKFVDTLSKKIDSIVV